MICPFCREHIDNLTYKEYGETYYTLYENKPGNIAEDVVSYPESAECLLPCCEGGFEGLEKEDVEALVLGEAILIPAEITKDKVISYKGAKIYAVRFKDKLFYTSVTRDAIWGRSEHNDWFKFHILYLAGTYRFLYPKVLNEITPLEVRRILREVKEIDEDDLVIKYPDEEEEY